MKNKNLLRTLTFLLLFVFITSIFLPTAYAGKLNDYKVHNSGMFGIGGKWKYQKNNDGENTITLVKCNYDKEVNLTSPIDNHDITRIGKNFSFVKHVVDHTYAIKHYAVLVVATITIIPAPLIWFMEALTQGNRGGQSIWEHYAEHYDIYSNIINLDLPKCIAVEEGGLKNNYNLKKVNLPNCKKIGPNAFLENYNLEDITLSKNYNTVEDGTFESCFLLKDFKNSDVVRKLGNRSFFHTGLERLNLKSCETIGDRCFAGCKDLCSVNLPACKILGDNVFYDDQGKFYYVGFHSNHNYTGGTRFYLCEKLKNVCLPVCKKIGNMCFCQTGIEEVNFPMCEVLGERSFADCKNLKSVYLPKCASIGNATFENCLNLEKVSLDKCETLGKGAFKNCSKLETVYSPNCKKIEADAFDGCNSLLKLVVSKDCKFEENSISIQKILGGPIEFFDKNKLQND